ncbi:DUF3833 domain-containing protein [Agarivorans sp. Z349TD_8]|uniref:DUF3833 domain-containing protein n=1 Tax=Agarivorans sp. Z349TD_8 TaxID=3421434 RepID=UPI003D7E4536
MRLAQGRHRRYLLLIVLLAGLFGCARDDVGAYAANHPQLLLKDFFNGELTAHGIVKNRDGELIRYFNVSMQARWDEQGQGTLDEHFEFDDGERQRRIWTLQPQEDGRYLASANDVSQPVSMRISGNALFMEYVLSLQYQGKPLDVNVKDKMYLVNPRTIINESQISKFGFTLGSVSLVIQKLP